MKIYTKTGDDGTTGLVGGARLSKGDARIALYGTVDELNAAIGLAAVASSGGLDVDAIGRLRAVQNDLFVIGAHLATPDDRAGLSPSTLASLPKLNDSIVARLEDEIDVLQAELPALQQFILPGGSEASARLHLARTVCRRAERLAVSFAGERPVPSVIVTYLNRLSDWLFVEARMANLRAGVEDVPWEK